MNKIGTHDSMTYLKPKKWYMYPFRFMARCQRISVKEQYEKGARMFDLRVSFDKEGVPEFRHGLIAFKEDVQEVLKYLNSKGRGRNKIYVRLILEISGNHKDAELCRQEKLFVQYCAIWESKYKNLVFFCGRRKYDWEQIYTFELLDVDVVQKVSSMTGTVLDDWFPWLYAKLFNKKNFENRDKTKWLLIDFIDMIDNEQKK